MLTPEVFVGISDLRARVTATADRTDQMSGKATSQWTDEFPATDSVLPTGVNPAFMDWDER